MKMTWDYLAGFFDGEGSLVSPNAKDRPRNYPPVFSITQVDRRPLDAIRDFVGDGIVSLREQSRTSFGSRPIHVYTLSRVATLRRILPELLDRCIVKRDVVQWAIADLVGRREVLPAHVVKAITPEAIRDAFRKHETRKATATALGFRSTVSLYAHMKKHGVEWPTAKSGRKPQFESKLTPEMIRAALQEHGTLRAASLALGMRHYQTLERLMEKYGISWPKMNGGRPKKSPDIRNENDRPT